MLRSVKERKIMDGHHQRGVSWRRDHPARGMNDIKVPGPRLNARPSKSMPGFVQRNPTQTHVANLDRRHCELVGWTSVRGRHPHDLPLGVLRQRAQTGDGGSSGATRNAMPTLLDDGTDATPHRLSGRGRVDFL